MNALETLEMLESTNGSNAKLAILKSEVNNNQLAELLDAALNFKRKFFVKKWDDINKEYPRSNNYDLFLKLLNILESRQKTGNEALELVQFFFSGCSPLEEKWYSRVLKKDLRCGIGITEVNKAGFSVPEFDVMLAKNYEDCSKFDQIVANGVYVSPKLDGYRCLAICSMGTVTLYSRNGTIYNNFPTIVTALQGMCKDSSFVLDGEVMSDDFNSMQQSAFAKVRGTVVGDVIYHVFGWISLDEWESGNFKMPTKQRLDNLKAFFDKNAVAIAITNNIALVPQILLNRVEDVMDLTKRYISQGYEGGMALPNIPYFLGKKSNRLMKLKEFDNMDCTITDTYEGEGRLTGTLGGFVVQQPNGQTCRCGSGFSDDEREHIWNNRSDFIGKIIEIQYQELTPDGVMRFPTMIRFRDDK